MAKDEPGELQFLIDRARGGSREAFDVLISRFEKKVVRIAFYLTRRLEDAEDVAQEVYVKIYRHLAKVKDSGHFDRWVYRITMNAAHDLLRKRRYWEPIRTVISSVTPRDPVHRAEIRSRLTDSLARLSFRERAAFLLKEFEGLDTADVAAVMGCSQVTVRGFLHSARKKLQGYMADLRD